MTDVVVKQIKNENWTIKLLASKVVSREIYKPKYQRKRKWNLFPKKVNVPSEKKYIEFLYDASNSVHAITFGQDNGKILSNIDGNNRINAIMHFLKEPFVLFPEKLDNLKDYISNYGNDKIDEKIAHELSDKVIKIVEKLAYVELMGFRYNIYFKDKHQQLYDEHLKIMRDDLEPLFDELIEQMKINNVDRFDETVQINVNLFLGYTTEELADVFSKINQYNSGLTEQEALASRLFNITNFIIEDKILECEIKQFLNKYYMDRTKDEILDCYMYNEIDDKMNAYDFMVGFQDYSNDKCSLIHKTDNDGLSLFFKIFKNIYKGSFDITFNTENVNTFIGYITKAINILQKLKSIIFMENLVGGGGNTIFDAATKKLNSLKKNNMYLVITAIIGYIKNNTSENEILSSIEKTILYHFFVNSIEDKEKRDQFKLIDGILYDAGGSFIDNVAKDYLKTPETISCKITEELMESVLNQLINENVKNKKYEIRSNGKDKNDKRRQRKLHEKVLIYYYYICKVPTQFLKKNFWVEHMFPFSCSWEDNLDIDRLGNIFPILDNLNKERSNKHISEYKKIDKEEFMKFIDIIPTNELYDQIVSHKNKKPHIQNSDKYNLFCSDNEKKLINYFLKKIF